MKGIRKGQQVLRELACPFQPFEVVELLGHSRPFAFLDSSLNSPDNGRFSLIGVDPDEELSGTDWGRLEDKLAARQAAAPPQDHGLPTGAAIGTVDYEGGFHFHFYNTVFVHDHMLGKWFGTTDIGRYLPSGAHSGIRNAGRKPIQFVPDTKRGEFLRRVLRLKEYIAAGDIYQANLSQRFIADWDGDALAFYEYLRSCSPSPYAAYIDQGTRTVLSTSPELFLRMDGRGIKTCPIKGTRPRFSDPADDERSAFELLTSEKERAELIMITDLERNDLGAICQYGSINVTKLLHLERFEQVFHLVSTVEGQLRDDVSHPAALKSCFPGGSITGAPKKRAREIIHELECAPRGLYTGAIGYFSYQGDSQFNIAIRTVIHENRMLKFHVGAGIVADSIPEKEYRETIHKAAGIMQAAKQWNGAQ